MTLAPYIFVIAVDHAMWQATQGKEEHADEIFLLSDEIRQSSSFYAMEI